MVTEAPEKIIPGEWKPPYETVAHEIAITSIPPEPQATFIDTFSALLVPTIAVVALFVGIAQALINRARLKHELFDRRYSIFEATNKLIIHAINEDEINYDQLQEFYNDTRGARFLFNHEFEKNYLNKISKQVLDLRALQKKLRRRDVADNELIDQITDAEDELTNELEKIDDAFEPYLGINK